MSLPASVIPRSKVTLSGGEVEVRGLTIVEVRTVRRRKHEDEADILAISLATDMPEAEAREWFEQASAGDLQKIMAGIFTASGLDEGATFPSAADDDARAERPDA